MFSSVLVANRGEIALRIMATCRQMGIRTIAVYSEADRRALHVRSSDVAYPIGPAPARDSYLNMEALIRVAKQDGAEAIHPGYGFLSENADFAEACRDAGICFIGPTPDAIRLMGSKTAAKQAVEAVGVPTVPGYAGERRDLRTLLREAGRIGYPVMIKASAGGGGKGMRVVWSREEFADALAAAEREALAAFGDDAVFLEKLIEAPRHIEFQILGDQYGKIVHLGERECSIQRRHQKVVEESPSAALTEDLRAAMGDAAVKAATAAGYVNAGTCEFLLDQGGHFYFLEMNTRLQVEHPVTELVTGLDLVRLQLEIASGLPLAIEHDSVVSRGHAIELRVYAEDPAHSYLPSTGTVLSFTPPSGPGIRVDTGITSGDEVTLHYDPMLAKLIVYGSDRAAAIQRARWALERFTVLGVATNMPLLSAIVCDPDYVAGDFSTAFLDSRGSSFSAPPGQMPEIAVVAAALFETLAPGRATSERSGVGEHGWGRKRYNPYNPWTSGDATPGWPASRAFRYHQGDMAYLVTLQPDPSRAEYTATINGKPFRGETAEDSGDNHDGAAARISAELYGDSQLVLAIGPREIPLDVARTGAHLEVSYRGYVYTLARPRPLDVETSAHTSEWTAGHEALKAPMAGTVIKVQVNEGDVVAANQPLLVLGAMKMEHALVSLHAGRVSKILHAVGDVVPGGELLIELDSGRQDEDSTGTRE
jgi:3-methylcrotonyl-CoA carboxylase alpha subunit